jgi:hypothetical protein
MSISRQLGGEFLRQWRPEGLLLELSLPVDNLRD